MQLDMEQVNALEPEARSRYMALERFFATPGWKFIQKYAKEKAEAAVPRAAFATNWADNRIAVGYGYAMNEIAQFEETQTAEYARMALEALAGKAAPASDEIDFE